MSTVEDQGQIAGGRLPVKRSPAAGLQDDPVAVRSNLQPASIDVSSNLAEDTVIAGVMDIAEGANKVAMFANPFTNGNEEMLYIDEQNTLRWARHVNPSSPAAAPPEHEGWSIDPIASEVAQVVVVVHPNGTVCAWVQDLDPTLSMYGYMLQADPAVPGGLRWRQFVGPGPTFEDAHLSVQYCNDRPATPVVFFVERGGRFLKWLTPLYPAPDSPNQKLWHGGLFEYDEADADALIAVGVDNPQQVGTLPEKQVATVRLWSLIGGALWLTTYSSATRTKVRHHIADGWTSLVGTWAHPYSAGVVGTLAGASGAMTLALAMPYGADADVVSVPLDQPLSDLVVWQDAANLLHVYGRDSDGGLSVVHQLGWEQGTNPVGLLEPLWDTHIDKTGTTVATTRPLVADVATFALDAYPDDMPNQHVMHQGMPAGETCAIYTQDLRTSFWSREKMRLIPKTIPKPYTVPRYETTLTVKNAFGAAVPGCQVSLTADAPVDLEVAGRFYRTDPVTPATLYTDLRGQVILRVVATGLAVPQLHVTVPGLAQAVSVQMAADVHKFLAGNGTLPGHPDGFTADVVTNAKVPGSTTPLFPNINRGPAEASWPPSAQDVVTWCQAAFAVDAGTSLPPAMLAELGEGEQVHAFTLQIHDSNRPGFQVFTSADQVATHRAALHDQGIIDELDTWFGDVWQGISQGVTQIAEVVVSVLDQTITLIIQLADEIAAAFTVAWGDIVSAAHAVEAVFVAIGAEIQQAIDWLKWAFGMKDVWDTKIALEQSIDVMVPFITETLAMLKEFGGDWLKEHEVDVRNAFEAMKQDAGDRTIGGMDAPALPDGKLPPATTLVKDRVNDPHLSWLTEHVSRVGSTATPLGLPTPNGRDTDPFSTLIAALGSSPAWSDLGIAASDAGQAFADLLNFNDSQTGVAQAYVALLDMFEHLVVGLLELGDGMLSAIVTFIEDMIGLIPKLLATVVKDPLVELVYEFVQTSAGVPSTEIEPATIGGVGLLLASFPTTVLFKMITGAAPFPGGTFPSLPFAPAEQGVGRDYPGGTLFPPEGWDYLKAWQLFQGLLMAIDGPFDVLVDASAYYDDDAPAYLKPPPAFWQAFAVAHWIAYALGDFPYLWGNQWPPNRPPDATALPYLSWAISAFVNSGDLGCAFHNGYFIAKFEDRTGVGPLVLSSCGIGRIIVSACRYFFIGTQSSTDLLNMWINITSFESSASGYIRAMYKQFGASLAPLMDVKILFDLVCDLFAGIVTTYQTAYTNENPPVIGFDSPELTPGTVGQDYEYQFTVSGGWPPYSWDAAGSTLPPGLALDPDTGLLSGMPTAAATYRFRVQVTDYSGPSFTFLTFDRELTIGA